MIGLRASVKTRARIVHDSAVRSLARSVAAVVSAELQVLLATHSHRID